MMSQTKSTDLHMPDFTLKSHLTLSAIRFLLLFIFHYVAQLITSDDASINTNG
ncbi:hypothetical protein [Xenorhabdus japonica]|uniref:hypothetical protein n=1 Tax=Xenorhabdus japonica TaxID=53341 RepID=UPI001587CF7B|nr:hypothetical protein [Xenorhabdus japonica]